MVLSSYSRQGSAGRKPATPAQVRNICPHPRLPHSHSILLHRHFTGAIGKRVFATEHYLYTPLHADEKGVPTPF